MAMVVDPICGMRIDSDDAVATAEYEDQTFYFCSEVCRDVFVANRVSDAVGTEPERLIEIELAERSGVSIEDIRELVNLGILEPENGRFSRRDLMRARVVPNLAAKGIGVEAIGTALASGHLTLGYLESAGRRFPRSNWTFSDLGRELGIPVNRLQMLYVTLGLPRPQEDEFVREEDLPVLRALSALFAAGVGDGEVLRAVRVWGDSIRRVARFHTHFFHNTIEQPFRARGLRDNEAFEAANREVSVRMDDSSEQMLAWLYRRHEETFLLEHEFEHVETALEEAGVRPRSPRGIEAAAFADLSGYTKLTEEAGDEVAAHVSITLAQLVNEVATGHRGEVVKMLGDGVHFHFRDPNDAVMASLDIVETVVPRGLPPAHIGVNAGPMIYEEGDYFGRTVNIAARIAAQASANQVFVGEDLVRDAEPRGFTVHEVGPFDLKGIARQVTLYRAERDRRW
jgi:adenylate cyclase